MIEQRKYYNNDIKIKQAGYSHKYTKDEIVEMVRCSSDFIYFCLKYIKIVDQDKAQLIPFDFYDYQKRLHVSLLFEECYRAGMYEDIFDGDYLIYISFIDNFNDERKKYNCKKQLMRNIYEKTNLIMAFTQSLIQNELEIIKDEYGEMINV